MTKQLLLLFLCKNMRSELLEWQECEMGGGSGDDDDDDGQMGRGRRNGVVLVRLWEGGGADVVSHLQCSAGLHHPISSQLSVKGAGPEADDSQGEFSVRGRERDSECLREKVSERESASVQRCPVLQDSA